MLALMARPVAKLLLLFSVIVAAILVALLVFTFTRPKPPAPSMPNPNGYADFVAAGRMLAGDFTDYRRLAPERLRTMLLTNSECLKRLRLGLTHECRVPLDYSPGLLDKADPQPIVAHFTELPLLKRLALALAAEGRLAELDQHPREAMRAYLNGFRFSQESVRGGIIIDVLVGIAMETIHLQHLEKLSSTLDAQDCRELAAALEEIESRRESPSEVLQQERTWTTRAYGLRGLVQRLIEYKSIRSTERATVSRMYAQQSRTRVLLMNVAARACELENGRPPATLAELVPAYLKRLPQDPRSGTNMVWRP